MIEHKICPACGAPALRKVGERRLELVDPPRNIQQGGGNAILTCVIQSESHTTTTFLCRTCRHLFLSPTFEEMELNRLYSPGCLAETKRQYRESERASGKSWAEQHAINPSTQDRLKSISKPYRSKRLYDVVSSITPPSDIRKILDFGAQTGDMTECFSGGVQRYVYDKDLSAVVDQSVIPLRSFSAVEASGPYDLIVLSHVLEHVPFPADLLGELRRHLSETGLLYVEVPIEYCGAIIKRQGIPLGAHINYFCRSSLSACLNVAGFNRMAARREIVPYGECQIPALKMVACRNKGRPGASCHRPWWIDLIVDALLILRVRKWPKRFD